MNSVPLLRRPFRYGYFNATLYIIAANIVCFAAGYAFPAVQYYMALNPAAVMSGCVWQLFTYMFAHADITHLLVNMIGLFIFGRHVERSMGSKEFLLYYLLTGFLAGVFSFAVYAFAGAWRTILLGASGAIFSLLLAFAVVNPDAIVYLYGIIPLKAPVMVLGYAGIEIASQVFSFGASVAHLTHLAGFAWGWIYFAARFGINPAKRLFRRRR